MSDPSIQPPAPGTAPAPGAAHPPLCSIVMPCYNRAAFLSDAFEAINAQSHQNWELIVVDDGSTDDTRTVVERLSPRMRGPVRYVHQANAGAAGAHNTGLDHATGRYIAFYDSDDLWLGDHLARCIGALEAHADVDWVYAACRIVVMDESNRVAEENVFYLPGSGVPRPFLGLRNELRGELHIIKDDRAVACAIEHGLFAGFQSSVYRAGVFDGPRIPPFRVGEDQLFIVQTLKRGCRPAYFNRVQVIYRVHSQNISGARRDSTADQRVALARQVIGVLEAMPTFVSLTKPERAAWRRRLAEEYFWKTGYTLFMAGGERRKVLADLHRAMRYTPWTPGFWKCYLVTRIKYLLGRAPERHAAAASHPGVPGAGVGGS